MTKKHVIAVLAGAVVPVAVVAAPVNWVVDVDGDWETPSNWSSDPALPGPGDDVVIDRPGFDLLVSINASQSIRSLQSQESIHLVDGNLTLSAGGDVHGAWTMNSGRSLTVNGGSFAAHGPASINGGNLLAASGGTISLLNLASYAGSTSPVNTDIRATGAGSAVELPALTSLAGNTFASALLRFQATGGGALDLSALTAVTSGKTSFVTQGAGSTIDLSALSSINHTGNIISRLEATSGGTILSPSLSSLHIVALVLDETGVMNTAQLVQHSEGELRLTGATPRDFSGITNASGTSLLADGGAIIALPSVSSYAGSTRAINTEVRATGTGSRIDLSEVTSLTGNSFASALLNVRAVSGGVVDLSRATGVGSGKVAFVAEGAGSIIDLSSLESINHTGNIISRIHAFNGGQIIAPGLTDLHIVNLVIDGPGTFATGQLQRHTEGELRISGVSPDFGGIVDASGTSMFADGGATIALPSISNVSGSTRAINSDLRAAGPGSRIDLSSASTMAGNTFASAVLRVDALAGGVVDLSGVVTHANGRSRFTADGADSLIDLSSLESFTSTGNIASQITAANGGRVALNATGPGTLTDVHLILTDSGTIDGQEIRLVSTGTTELRTARLLGAGLLDASLVNTSGQIRPAGAGAGGIGISGNLTLGADGTVFVDLLGTGPGEFDRLLVGGDATLAGTLDLLIAPAVVFELGQSFTILDIAGTRSGIFDGLPHGSVLASQGELDLVISYTAGAGQSVALQVVPEPGALALVALAGPIMLRRRR